MTTGNTYSHYDVVIVGAGIPGLGAAAQLLRHGIDNFVVLEKADAVAGTWRDNTCPGCACDVPSALYSYSFAEMQVWTRTEPLRAGQDSFNERVQEALGGTVYNAGGCRGCFFDVNGRNSFDWPWSTDRMLRELSSFDAAAFDVASGPSERV